MKLEIPAKSMREWREGLVSSVHANIFRIDVIYIQWIKLEIAAKSMRVWRLGFENDLF